VKRTAIFVWALLAGAAVFGLVKVLPTVRHAIDTQRQVRRVSLREPGAQADWRREFGDPERTLAAFPRGEDTENAARLIELAREVDIEMARRNKESLFDETGGRGVLSRAISGYAQREVTKTGGEIAAPPERVRTFLDQRERQIDDIVELLSDSKPPGWESDVLLGYAAPVPNLMGQMRLHRVLAARALDLAHQGRKKESERVFRASWNLNTSLRERGEMVSQMIAIAIARMQAGLARRLPLDAAAWRGRLTEHDYRESLLRSMEVEAIAALPVWPTDSLSDRASRAEFLDARRKILVRLRDSPVGGEVGIVRGREVSGSDSRSPGAVVEKREAQNLPDAIRRADRLILDLELSQRVLEARTLKAKLGHWPAVVPGVDASRMPGEHWTYSAGKGRMTILFSRELGWTGPKGWILPLRYESN
jgi:hypothetical protein